MAKKSFINFPGIIFAGLMMLLIAPVTPLQSPAVQGAEPLVDSAGSAAISVPPSLGYGPGMGNVNYEIFETDSSGVDIDAEMSKLAENNLRYQTGVEALLRKFRGLKHAITEGGR